MTEKISFWGRIQQAKHKEFIITKVQILFRQGRKIVVHKIKMYTAETHLLTSKQENPIETNEDSLDVI